MKRLEASVAVRPLYVYVSLGVKGLNMILKRPNCKARVNGLIHPL